MWILKKNGHHTTEPIQIKTQFKADLKTLELLRLTNVLFRFAEQLPEGQEIFWHIEQTIQQDAPEGLQKIPIQVSPKIPMLKDFIHIIKQAIRNMYLSQNNIELILSFARTIDNMLLSEQIELLKTTHIAYALEYIIEDFIYYITQDGLPPKTDLEDVKKVILQNIKNKQRLDFKECLLVANINE